MKIVKTCTTLALLGFLGLSVAAVSGLKVNTTPSIPVGFYWQIERPVNIGEYVMVCPPQNQVTMEGKRRGYIKTGFCPGDMQYLMKKVYAVTRDVVAFNDDGVYVNGLLIPHSQPLTTDRHGRPLPKIRGEHRLTRQEVLVMTDRTDDSFDSRYFGVITKAHIVNVVKPVWTW